MKNIMRSAVLYGSTIGTGLVMFAQVAMAQLGTPPTGKLPDVSGTQSLNTFFTTYVCGILDWIYYIAIILSVLFILIAAFKYITSGGNPEKTNSAGKSIVWAAVGIVVAILAKGIPLVVGSFFGANTSSLKVCG